VKVFGIDIIKGSVRSKSKRPIYALVRMEDGGVTSEGQVSLFRLLRLLSAEEPDILAVDSLQEVAADQKDLFSFIQALPSATRLVQVTGGERKESLGKVAARYNISFNKFDPFAEARTIAKVASLGGGAEVIAFENSCDITVSRHRSIGKGGWSQNRYVRKIHGAVQQRGREIEAALREAGLDYEMKESRAFGGASRIQFRVAASRDMVPVRSVRGSDVQVRVMGRRLDRIRFRPLQGRPRYLIVGIDPGTTIGIAAIDLDGALVHLISSRQMTMSDVIEELFRVGKPLIVASDVAQMPFSVEKIRRAFKAVAYTPRTDRTQEEKVEMTAAYEYSNDHERDSLSAALEAYRHYKNKFQSIIKRVPPGVDLDEVRAGVVRGRSLEQVLAELGKPSPPPVKVAEPELPSPAPRDERVMQLEGMVKSLRGFVAELQDELKEKEIQAARLEGLLEHERSEKADQLRKDAEITRREAIIASQKKRLRREERRTKKLVKRIERLKRFAELQMNSDHIPLKVLASLTKDGMRALDEDLGVGEGDLVLAQRTAGWGRSVILLLKEAGVLALIVSGAGGEEIDPALVTAFRECKVPLIPERAVTPQVRGKTGSVHRDDLEAALAAWERGQEDYAKEKKTEMLESIFKEYQSERERERRRHG
jgi:predicted RNase H-like nuclease (RuvC/YqgF family)